MTLRRWDIVFVRERENDPTGHPGVVFSPEGILQDERYLRFNILMGSKKTAGLHSAAQHVVLNGADGLDQLTVVDCSLVAVASKTSVIRLGGTVALVRRQVIQRKVRDYLGLS